MNLIIGTMVRICTMEHLDFGLLGYSGNKKKYNGTWMNPFVEPKGEI